MNPQLDLDKYKAIFSDYDGTLSGSDFTISPNVKEAISRWVSLGKKFSIITGKSFQGAIQKNCQDLGLKDPIAVLGGSEIVDPRTGESIFSEPIPPVEIPKIIKELDESGFAYEMNDHNNVYTNSIDLKKKHVHKKYVDLDKIDKNNVLKAVLVVHGLPQEKIDALMEKFKTSFKDIHIIEGRASYTTGIDITSSRANKHMAMLKLCEILAIDPSEVIGVGDGPNDYPLLSASGYKVAIGSATKELLEIADFVAPSEEEDGLAVFMNQILA